MTILNERIKRPAACQEEKIIASSFLASAADLNIKKPDHIIDAIIRAVSAWQDVYAAYGVPDTEIQKFDRDISYRLDKLKHSEA